jgi:hypothetical protein
MAYCIYPGWLWWWRIWWNDDWQGKPKFSEKTCPSATLSATNPTWPDPGANPGRRGGNPATNRLSYGAATTSTKSALKLRQAVRLGTVEKQLSSILKITLGHNLCCSFLEQLCQILKDFIDLIFIQCHHIIKTYLQRNSQSKITCFRNSIWQFLLTTLDRKIKRKIYTSFAPANS